MSPSNSRGLRYPFSEARSTNRLYRIGVNLSLASFDLTPGRRVAASLAAAPAAPSPIAPRVITHARWIRVLLVSHAWLQASSTRAVKVSDERRFVGWDSELGARTADRARLRWDGLPGTRGGPRSRGPQRRSEGR